MAMDSPPFPANSRVKRTPNRQSRSCKVCRARKVKCDRVKPCHACCAHGYPSKCVYEDVPDEDARPISQAEEIQNLRLEIRELRARIDERKDQSQAKDLARLDQLESLFDSIRSAPLSEVDTLVRDIRTTQSGLKKGLIAVGPWEDYEAYEDHVSPRTVIPLRTRSRNATPESNFNDPVTNADEETEFGDEASDETSETSGSSGVGSIINLQRSAVDVFVERFVDAFAPMVDSKHGRAGALRAAAGIRMFSPLMSDAFEAVSVAFFGRSIQNKQVEASGFRLYPRVLRALQDALVDPERSKAESTLVTVTLLLAFESVERTTHSGVPAHVRGAVRLIEHRGPENHMYGVEHLLFTELRPYWIGGALAARQPSFLAREEWKTIPWSAGTTKKDMLHHLLDVATEIPGLLAQSDQFKESQAARTMGAQETAVKQVALWNGITECMGKFQQWYEEWVVQNSQGLIQEVEQNETQDFPIFRRRDLRTGAIYAPTRFIYPNLLLAQTMCLYYAVRLILSSIDTRPQDRVTPMEQYELGCGICRTMAYYILTAPGNMINRLAFPTRVAWEAFPDGGPERAFLAEVLQLVERRHALGLWGSAMAELSVRQNSPLNSESDV
ncbi:Fungal Zn(2)-Cys(6) binuclear cluster domain-containing protein [Penicillium ucsense]|uniref:Fungal Zn(2)-Cys(6) binuclear cluster domain-containing protein n=1 Tax=Penicillium ucsense TaxID=2839758 RepID=A0A8J8WI19_9EURO|nr:Fungal Zn(2)-Cys(6) binuclear cluster domain-containing protein [Penicillium ucsense]KAF7739048.1 Fungal Zn(2)-Cys(6) binuclear cluster domain-containing protein [Penicillium ucsense]